MLMTNRHKTLDEICVAAKAVIEHLFNNHEFCEKKWCHMKAYENELKDLQVKGIDTSAMEPPSHPFKYRSKTDDPELYIEMKDAFEPWGLPERLIESLHGESTQLNEALNLLVSKYAPKTKTYGSSMSLQNRIAIAIGVQNYGQHKFFSLVYNELGKSSFSQHLQRKDSLTEKRREYEQRLSVKKKRSQKRNDETKQLLEKQKRDKETGSTYGSPGTLNIVVPEEVWRKENEIKELLDCQCELYGCYAGGHKTKASKKCKYHTCLLITELHKSQ